MGTVVRLLAIDVLDWLEDQRLSKFTTFGKPLESSVSVGCICRKAWLEIGTRGCIIVSNDR